MKQYLLRLACLALLFVPHARAQADIRIGVLSLFHPRELVLEPGSRQVLLVKEAHGSLLLNGEREHRRLVFRAEGDRVLAGGVTSIRWQVSARDGAPVRFELAVPGKIHRVYQGTLELTARHGELTAIVVMDRELAVASIVASEMPQDAQLEALKAQAVVTRSFLAAGSRHHSFDFCDTTHCQFLRSPDDAGSRTREAVKATQGTVLFYEEHPLAAMYSSRCGGQTRSLNELGFHDETGYPYYGVSCRWCREHPVHWQTRIDPAARPPASENENERIAHARQWGWSALPGNVFTVKEDANGLLIQGHSVGHGLGLCQFGALGMASSGADFRTILAYYYPNSELRQLP